MADDDITAEPGFRDKLVASKQAWARAGRLLTGRDADPATDRLPPGQRLVENWPVLDLGIQPDVPRDQWELTVGGLVENPVTWDFAALQAEPQFEDTSDIHCVTSWSRYDNRWQGVSTRHLVDVVRPKPEAAHVILHGYDGYVTNLRLADFVDDDCLLAHSHDGQSITREHGGPVRVVIPRYYLWKSAKWLKAIEFVADDHPGFWETRGYHNVADPWLEQRYS
jgi:DMSO/TMAO reductase YedYZ molybdopterin-dependent catalytic subunit